MVSCRFIWTGAGFQNYCKSGNGLNMLKFANDHANMVFIILKHVKVCFWLELFSGIWTQVPMVPWVQWRYLPLVISMIKASHKLRGPLVLSKLHGNTFRHGILYWSSIAWRTYSLNSSSTISGGAVSSTACCTSFESGPTRINSSHSSHSIGCMRKPR